MFSSRLILASAKHAVAGKAANTVGSSALAVGARGISNEEPLSPAALKKQNLAYLNELKMRIPTKPPSTGFGLWKTENKIQGVDIWDLSRLYSNGWNNLSPKRKHEYFERALDGKVKYNDELDAFKKSLTHKEKAVLRDNGIKLPRVLPRFPEGTPALVNPWLAYLQKYRVAHPPADNSLASQSAFLKAASKSYRAGKRPDE